MERLCLHHMHFNIYLLSLAYLVTYSCKGYLTEGAFVAGQAILVKLLQEGKCYVFH